MWSKFPDICLIVEENSRKTSTRNWPDQGSNPGLLGERQQCYPEIIAVINIKINKKEKQTIWVIAHYDMTFAPKFVICFPNSHEFLTFFNVILWNPAWQIFLIRHYRHHSASVWTTKSCMFFFRRRRWWQRWGHVARPMLMVQSLHL